MKNILNIENLNVMIDKNHIIKNLNLKIAKGETHVIMGPNGSGKSTLSKILVGHPSYQITSGQINFLGENLLSVLPEKRAHKGLFLAFQYPLEVHGITNYEFLRTVYNEKQKYLKKEDITPLEFTKHIQKYTKKLNLNESFLLRNLNEGFSGGEKKRNEILQMLLLKPKLAILDEIDSGVDIDALKTISKSILDVKKDSKKLSLLIITHYPKILEYLVPDIVHVMMNGNIVYSGNYSIVKDINKYGYNIFNK
jgi:Fe-S cluster assembly ATP-binding protein